jgi:hypothetical protein
MQVLVGGDHRRGDLGAAQQFLVVGGDEVGADLLGDQLAARRILLGDADPFDRRMAARHRAADQADPARADDGQADTLRVPVHGAPPVMSAGTLQAPALFTSVQRRDSAA